MMTIHPAINRPIGRTLSAMLAGISLSLPAPALIAQGVETFDAFDGPANRYAEGSFTGDAGVLWSYAGGRAVRSTYHVDGTSLGFAAAGDEWPRRHLTGTIANGGMGSLRFAVRAYFLAGTADERQLRVLVNGIEIGAYTLTGMTEFAWVEWNELAYASPLELSIESHGTRQVVIDSLSWTGWEPDPGDPGGTLPALFLLAPAQVSEGDAVTLRVVRDGQADTALVVRLVVSDPDALLVPEETSLGANEMTAEVTAQACMDGLVTGDRLVTVIASASDYKAARADIRVIDADRGMRLLFEPEPLRAGEGEPAVVRVWLDQLPPDGTTVALQTPAGWGLPALLPFTASNPEHWLPFTVPVDGVHTGPRQVTWWVHLSGGVTQTLTVMVDDADPPALPRWPAAGVQWLPGLPLRLACTLLMPAWRIRHLQAEWVGGAADLPVARELNVWLRGLATPPGDVSIVWTDALDGARHTILTMPVEYAADPCWYDAGFADTVVACFPALQPLAEAAHELADERSNAAGLHRWNWLEDLWTLPAMRWLERQAMAYFLIEGVAPPAAIWLGWDESDPEILDLALDLLLRQAHGLDGLPARPQWLHGVWRRWSGADPTAQQWVQADTRLEELWDASDDQPEVAARARFIATWVSLGDAAARQWLYERPDGAGVRVGLRAGLEAAVIDVRWTARAVLQGISTVAGWQHHPWLGWLFLPSAGSGWIYGDGQGWMHPLPSPFAHAFWAATADGRLLWLQGTLQPWHFEHPAGNWRCR